MNVREMLKTLGACDEALEWAGSLPEVTAAAYAAATRAAHAADLKNAPRLAPLVRKRIPWRLVRDGLASL